MPNIGAKGILHKSQSGDRCVPSPRILVVDDIQDNLDLIVDLFEEEPWNVRTADNSKDAWALIKRWHPALILLDIQMPHYNGHHLCTAIRTRPDMDDVAVIFLTAERTSQAEIERGLEMGAVDYICKPVDGTTLRERVRTIIGPHEGRMEDAMEAEDKSQCRTDVPRSKTENEHRSMTSFMSDDVLADALTELAHTQQPLILAVDDIPDNLDLVVDVLNEEPWRVVTAGNAREAWKILKQSSPDLVLLDIQMPDIDGHQLCSAIRKLPQMGGVPIIFLTAERLSPGDVVHGLELGADDYICKPFHVDELRARVRTALRRRLDQQ